MQEAAILGCILGTAVGDSIGLPYEGMRPQRIAKFLRLPLRQRFIFGHGMISDDTEHTCLVAKTLLVANGEVNKFEQKLAWSLRFWFLGLPAGIGLATGRAIIKLCLGFPPKYSGVFSAGNGPAMRSALIGVVYADDLHKLTEFVYRCTHLTHTDPKAYFGALTVALAARSTLLNSSVEPAAFIQSLIEVLGSDISAEYQQLLAKILASIERNESLTEFAVSIGCKNGVSGYVYHTVPCVVQCWLRHQHNFAAGLTELIQAGGDTDTSGAIYGAIAGTQVGQAGIPVDWIEKINDYPYSTNYMQRLAGALSQTNNTAGKILKPPYFNWPAFLLRNLFFLSIVLLYGFRRLLPPY